MYIRKTRDRYDIMAYYDSNIGWERETSEDTLSKAKQRLREYRENGVGIYRLEKHREPIK